ncbi:MAG: imelysin family protein [Hydrogenophilaceae bacterium]|nr:imelysin family protein [Hydrogenophilaceae bacterium]
MKKWNLLMGLALMTALSAARADSAATIQAVQRDWLGPRAAEFARDSAALVPAVQALCDASADKAEASLQQARRQWLASLSSWERLSGVAIGPVLERRSQRQIDFTPTRPRMIEKAIAAEPKGPADMELIGTPAKGLPALEWLLWVKPVKPASPACRYAVQVAADIRHEAEALAAAKPSAVDPQAMLSELVNQWVGGLERLRWANMEMPVRVAITSGADSNPDYPRGASGASVAAWAAQWDALRSLAMQGEGSLQAALRARGQAKAADALAQAVKRAEAGMQGLTAADKVRILAAAKELAALKRLVENEVAPALGVSIGFSDSDGD